MSLGSFFSIKASNESNQFLGRLQSASVVIIQSKLAIAIAVLIASFFGEPVFTIVI